MMRHLYAGATATKVHRGELERSQHSETEPGKVEESHPQLKHRSHGTGAFSEDAPGKHDGPPGPV